MNYIKEISADICVLGGGPAGYVAAIRASQLGAKVVLVEERDIGGTCLNRGCIPTKALLKTTEALYMISKAKELGIESSISSIDANTFVSRKDRVVKNLRMGLEHLLSKNGIEVLRGKHGSNSGRTHPWPSCIRTDIRTDAGGQPWCKSGGAG